jgi:hypothetical protein
MQGAVVNATESRLCSRAIVIQTNFFQAERVGWPKFSQAFMRTVMAEDAFHNVVYGMVTVNEVPGYPALVSPAVFALVKWIAFLSGMFKAYFPSAGWVRAFLCRIIFDCTWSAILTK